MRRPLRPPSARRRGTHSRTFPTRRTRTPTGGIAHAPPNTAALTLTRVADSLRPQSFPPPPSLPSAQSAATLLTHDHRHHHPRHRVSDGQRVTASLTPEPFSPPPALPSADAT